MTNKVIVVDGPTGTADLEKLHEVLAGKNVGIIVVDNATAQPLLTPPPTELVMEFTKMPDVTDSIYYPEKPKKRMYGSKKQRRKHW